MNDGPHVLRQRFRVRIFERARGQGFGRPGTLVAEQPVEVSGEWTLAPKDTRTIRLRTDSALRARMAQAIKVYDLRTYKSRWGVGVMLTLHVGPLPVPIAMRAVLRSGQREWLLGRFHVTSNEFCPLRVTLDEADTIADRVDIVLRPDPEEMDELWVEGEAWGQEIVIKDVPVERE